MAEDKGQGILCRRIHWGDLDPLGIVFYPRYYEWIDGCAHQFFEDIGLPLVGTMKERGIIFALLETSCRYFHPGRYHDEILISTALRELDKKTLLLEHEIRKKAAGRRLLARCWERRICVVRSDHGDLRAVEIPSDILEVLQDNLNKTS